MRVWINQNENDMKHFDFILFENYQLATHHLYDVELIAKLLSCQGISVAIFDLYNQFDASEKDNIPIIHWTSRNKMPDTDWMHKKHSKWATILKSIRFLKSRNAYLREARDFLSGKADNYYCGSLYNGVPTIFFKIKKPCYWWGLRSCRMNFSWRELLTSPILGINKLIEIYYFKRNPMQRLFVSNPIIFNEFIGLGIPKERIVIREERCIDSIGSSKLDYLTKNTSFLVIGMLRPEKHIPLTISAFKDASIPNSNLYLVGRSVGDYEEIIESSIASDKHIIRQNKYLDYSDFNDAFQMAHFVLFADEEGASCISNGTFTEALINQRPVICPDCQPFKYYIEKYGIGITYKKGDSISYAEALQTANKLGVEYFMGNIKEFLKTLDFSKVSKDLVDNIRKNNGE